MVYRIKSFTVDTMIYFVNSLLTVNNTRVLYQNMLLELYSQNHYNAFVIPKTINQFIIII